MANANSVTRCFKEKINNFWWKIAVIISSFFKPKISTPKLVYKLQISISKAVLKPKMYTSRVKINCFKWSDIKILAFLKIVNKVSKFLAILDKKIVAKSLQKSPKWWQIAKSGHSDGKKYGGRVGYVHSQWVLINLQKK